MAGTAAQWVAMCGEYAAEWVVLCDCNDEPCGGPIAQLYAGHKELNELDLM